MSPTTTTAAATKADVQPRVRDDVQGFDIRPDAKRRDPVKAWIRPAPGEDKYADVPCTD